MFEEDGIVEEVIPSPPAYCRGGGKVEKVEFSTDLGVGFELGGVNVFWRSKVSVEVMKGAGVVADGGGVVGCVWELECEGLHFLLQGLFFGFDGSNLFFESAGFGDYGGSSGRDIGLAGGVED